MIGLGLILLAMGLVGAGMPDPTWVFLIPALLWAPGMGWARWMAKDGPRNRVHLGIDAAWVSMGTAWVGVSIVRELGLTDDTARWTMLGLALGWCVAGLWAARDAPRPVHTPRNEFIGALAVVVAVVTVAFWRADDIGRHLYDHWYATGADQLSEEPLQLVPGNSWLDEGRHWPESGARQLYPSDEYPDIHPSLMAPEGAKGRIVVAVTGAIGTRIEVPNHPPKTVAPSMVEQPEEGAVRRYQDRGTAAVVVDLDLDPGESLRIQVDSGDAHVVTVFPSTLAVWELHGEGVLRFTHYYQMLNQVENLDWAEEVLTTRRFTVNQPPGWSPILATAGLFLGNDLVTGNRLFLYVILLVGITAVRLASTLAPSAPGVAWLVPAGMVASHGLLMIEPASTNFPDSLYAAAVLAVALALASGRTGWVLGAGIATGLLRWPGVLVATVLIIAWHRTAGTQPWRQLGKLWGVVAVFAVLAAIGVLMGELDDFLFILYFETFPEHWHGNYDPLALLSRIPDFFGLWTIYTGGGLVLAAAAWFARDSPARRGLRFILGSILIYSAVLCTVDHHPTHYFLPLVAGTGVAVVAGSASLQNRVLRIAFPTLCLAGLWIFLRIGQVY